MRANFVSRLYHYTGLLRKGLDRVPRNKPGGLELILLEELEAAGRGPAPPEAA
jgi:hypothetical protein